MSARLLRALILGCYAAVALVGAGMHLLEFAPREGCPACQDHSSGMSLIADCAGNGPCQDPAHHHHNHPVHEHEDGCATCSAFACQQCISAEPIAEACEAQDLAPQAAPRLIAAAPQDLPPGRAPPVA